MIHRFFLGRPPANIEKFIIDNYYASHVSEKTIVKYNNGSVVEYDIQGELKSDSIPNNTNAVEVQIGSAVTSIRNYAFQNCSSLSSTTIPDSVTSIGSSAFDSCSSLSIVYFEGKTLSEVQAMNFYPWGITDDFTKVTYKNNSVKMFKIEGELTNRSIENIYNVVDIQIGSAVTSISEGAFNGCTSLSSIQLPASLTSIGRSAFQSCTSLSNAYFEGKTLGEVQAMANYSWDIPNVSAIKVALPYGCVAVEYVQGSIEHYSSLDKCYIKTDIVPTLESVLTGSFMVPSTVTAPWEYIFGVQYGDDSSDQFAARIWDWNTSCIQGIVGSKSGEAVTIPQGVKFDMVLSKNEIIINGTSYAMPSPAGSVYNDYLYCLASNWSGHGRRSSKTRVYGFDITTNGLLVGRFVPVLFNSSIATLANVVTGTVCDSKAIISGPLI